MNKLPEAVSVKLSELFGAIQYAADELKLAGADANLVGDFSLVAEMNEACRKLQELETDIKAALSRFESKHRHRSKSKSVSPKLTTNRTRSSGGRIRVTVGNTIIEKRTIADTFVEALTIFGFDRVAKLNKFVTGAPLLAKSPINGYQTQRRVDGWYVTTHVNKQIASKALDDIGKELNIPTQIEIIEN